MTNNALYRQLAVQPCIPVAVYLSLSFRWELETLTFLLPNYLHMAAPHLLVSLLAFSPRARKPELIDVLILLNALLVVFRLWLYLDVAPREQSFAWIFYPPLWIISLAQLGAGYYAASREVR